jgi:hypothetical protein
MLLLCCLTGAFDDNSSVVSLTKVCYMKSHSLRNYITKDWFHDIALRQEPSPLAKRISEVLGVPASANDGKEAGK